MLSFLLICFALRALKVFPEQLLQKSKLLSQITIGSFQSLDPAESRGQKCPACSQLPQTAVLIVFRGSILFRWHLFFLLILFYLRCR